MFLTSFSGIFVSANRMFHVKHGPCMKRRNRGKRHRWPLVGHGQACPGDLDSGALCVPIEIAGTSPARTDQWPCVLPCYEAIVILL
jgi:hypothetical protein